MYAIFNENRSVGNRFKADHTKYSNVIRGSTYVILNAMPDHTFWCILSADNLGLNGNLSIAVMGVFTHPIV